MIALNSACSSCSPKAWYSWEPFVLGGPVSDGLALGNLVPDGLGSSAGRLSGVVGGVGRV